MADVYRFRYLDEPSVAIPADEILRRYDVSIGAGGAVHKNIAAFQRWFAYYVWADEKSSEFETRAREVAAAIWSARRGIVDMKTLALTEIGLVDEPSTVRASSAGTHPTALADPASTLALSQDELTRRIKSATELGEAMVVFAHRTDSTDYLVAGFRDSGGWDAPPSQIAKGSVAMMLLARAHQARGLQEGDARFANAMLAKVAPWAGTVKDARAALAEMVFPTAADVERQVDEFSEMALFMRSHGDSKLTATLQSASAACKAYERPWTTPALRRGIAPTVHGSRKQPATAQRTYEATSRPGPRTDKTMAFADRLEQTGKQGLEVSCLLLIVAGSLSVIALLATLGGAGAVVPGIVVAVIVMAIFFKNSGK